MRSHLEEMRSIYQVDLMAAREAREGEEAFAAMDQAVPAQPGEQEFRPCRSACPSVRRVRVVHAKCANRPWGI